MIAFSEQLLERRLLGRLRKGDREAFAEIVKQHSPRMMAVIRRFLNEHDSNDALQDALLSAYRAIGRFHSSSRLATWLHRIAVNAALMRIRATKRREECSIDELLPRFGADGRRVAIANWGLVADHGIDQAETREFVRSAIARLPEVHRAILILRDIEERSTEETARLLEISEANVKTRLHRARQALRSLLEVHFAS